MPSIPVLIGALAVGAIGAWFGIRLHKRLMNALDDPYFDERNWH